jgi:SAM-dependent methyltransferase
VVDAFFEDRYLASLYDRLCAERGDEAFYLHLMASAPSVLDVGCGTGTLLHRARAAGHTGRLCGLDPGTGMLEQARRHPGIEWVQGGLIDAGFSAEFALIVMTGHAFQVLLRDDDLRDVLAAARRALAPGGRFAFETRNPLARAWLQWTPSDAVQIHDDDGTAIRVWHDVLDVSGEYVHFTETFASESWATPRVSTSTLRFLPAERLDDFLDGAGLAVDERYGGWDRRLFTPASPEIITIAHSAG